MEVKTPPLTSIRNLGRKRVSGPNQSDELFSISGDGEITETLSSPLVKSTTFDAFVQSNIDRSTVIEQSIKKGETLLSELDRLKQDLLQGIVSQKTLDKLDTLTKDLSNAEADPVLKALLQEIAIRAQVERAKLQKINQDTETPSE